MFIPLPIFWALHAQQGSRWVFQATKMNGDIGWYHIKPDQMIVFNSVLGMILIPIFEHLFYPFLSRVGIKTSLQKMTLGGSFSVVAFIVAALVEFQVELQVEKNVINILWMFPQYLIIVVGEILLYTANLNFAYTEAPASMKSVMLGFMYLSVAGGCLIVVLISGVALYDSQAYEFLFFAGIMFLDVLLFGFLARRYHYVSQDQKKVER
jgi:dipeptide/tripeptide permease